MAALIIIIVQFLEVATHPYAAALPSFCQPTHGGEVLHIKLFRASGLEGVIGIKESIHGIFAARHDEVLAPLLLPLNPLPIPLLALPGRVLPRLRIPLTIWPPVAACPVPRPLENEPLRFVPFAISSRLFSSSADFLIVSSRLCTSSTNFLSFSCRL